MPKSFKKHVEILRIFVYIICNKLLIKYYIGVGHMNKGSIRGAIIGSCLTLALTIPVTVYAKAINADFNLFAVKSGANTIVTWGETYSLADGRVNPTSIIYNDTTYLPLRKIGEALGKQVLWNEDSRTVTIIDINNSMMGSIFTSCQKPDARGKLYTYSIFYDGEKTYLWITDSAIRSLDTANSRAYELLGSGAYRFDDDGVVFVTSSFLVPEGGGYGTNLYSLTKISYASTQNSQDGEVIQTIVKVDGHYKPQLKDFYINGDDVYYTASNVGGSFQYAIYRKNLSDSNEPSIVYSDNTSSISIKKVDGNVLYVEKTSSEDSGLTLTTSLWKVYADGTKEAEQISYRDGLYQ